MSRLVVLLPEWAVGLALWSVRVGASIGRPNAPMEVSPGCAHVSVGLIAAFSTVQVAGQVDIHVEFPEEGLVTIRLLG